MTLASSRGNELTVEAMVRRAYQLCGVMASQQGAAGGTSDFEMGRAYLDTILDAWQAEGVDVRSVVFEDVTLTSGTSEYNVSEDALDVIGDGMYIAAADDPDEAESETVVKQIDRETWHAISAKASTGRPTLMYVNRQPATVQIWLWPIPDEAGTVRVQIHRYLSDVTDGQYTMELRPYWVNAVLWSLAHHLAMAKGLPLGRCQYLGKQADDLKEKAKSYSNQHPDSMMVLDHPTAWRGR